MYKNILIRSLHKVSSFVPNKALCIFGNCKQACGELCMEEDINNIQSTRLKLHLSFCKKCWNYYHQMNAVNKAVTQNINTHIANELKKASPVNQIDNLTAKYSSK